MKCSSIPPANDGGFTDGGGGSGGGGLSRFDTFDLDKNTERVGYISMAVSKTGRKVGVAYLVQTDAFNIGPDSGTAVDGGGTPNWDVRYVEWNDGVASAPQVLRTVQRT